MASVLTQRTESTDSALSAKCQRAAQLARAGHEDQALALYADALSRTRNPGLRAGCYNDIGGIYNNRGQLHDALRMFEAALEIMPHSPDVLANLGVAHKWLGNLPEAERWLARALKANPWHNAAQFTQAICALLAGDYRRGFDLYECRFRARQGGLAKLETCFPEWDGTNGRRVYIYGEQGSGDIFLMLRYAKMIRALGVQQSWVVHRPMKTLVQRIPEIDLVVGNEDPLPEFDCHLPAASLPRLFDTTLETVPPSGYLPAPEPHDYGPGCHVGLAWRGSKAQLNDRFRSTRLDQWQPVLAVPGVTFHSLQVDGADEALLYPQIEMHDPPADWLETARRMAGLDLIISVDTSIIHAAGAMNLPCWCALHCRPYFVFPLVLEDCPWYATVRLFKQTREQQWQPVFESIARELQCLVTS